MIGYMITTNTKEGNYVTHFLMEDGNTWTPKPREALVFGSKKSALMFLDEHPSKFKCKVIGIPLLYPPEEPHKEQMKSTTPH